MIRFSTEQIPMPELIIRHKGEICRWIQAVGSEYGFAVGDINYLLCNDEYILQTNRTYLRHDYYTDVITFDYSTQSVLSGDIVISLETVESNAVEMGVNAELELCRILIHGVLHLTGQDDKSPDTKQEMTRKENSALKMLPSGVLMEEQIA